MKECVRACVGMQEMVWESSVHVGSCGCVVRGVLGDVVEVVS